MLTPSIDVSTLDFIVRVKVEHGLSRMGLSSNL